METRLKLHEELVELLGTSNVYFNPPESLKLKYPCFVYSRENIQSTKADNFAYLNTQRYQVIYVYKDPDDDMSMKVLEHFTYCSVGSTYTADSLYHDPITLYY